MNTSKVLYASALLLLFCGLAASDPSDFRLDLELNNTSGTHASFPVRCVEGCDWDEIVVDCPAEESVCRATIDGHKGLGALGDRLTDMRALSGGVCLGVGITSLDAARMQGLRADEPAGDEQGSAVAKVVEGSPADLAGFKVNDLVSSFNSAPILDSRDLFDAIQGTTAGQPFEATLDRDGAIVRVKGTLGTLTTAHACHPADAQLLQTAITPEELPRFKLVIAAPNGRFAVRCLEGCAWTEAGLSAFGPDPRPSIVVDQQDLRPAYPGQ